MDCIKYHEIISIYVDEEASAVQAEALEKHLESCMDCRTFLSSQLKLRDMIKDSFHQTIDVDFSISIMSRINPAEAKVSSTAAKKITVFIAAAAAACVIGISVLMSLQTNESPTVAGNEKLEEYVVEHVDSMQDGTYGQVEAVNLNR